MANSLPTHFEMFSEAGNKAVRQMIIAALDAHSSRDPLCAAIWQGIEQISKIHSEVMDTAVRESILYAVHEVTEFSIDELYPRIKFGKFGDSQC